MECGECDREICPTCGHCHWCGWRDCGFCRPPKEVACPDAKTFPAADTNLETVRIEAPMVVKSGAA